MLAEVFPSFAPTPSSVAELASRIPAAHRAQLEWFPQQLRAGFIEPLARASHTEFHGRLDALLVDAVRAVLRVFTNIGVLAHVLEPNAMAMAITAGADRHAHDLVVQRLEPVDAAAADDLREACEWLRTILRTTSAALVHVRAGEGAHARLEEPSALGDAELEQALVGEPRSFLRGLLLTVGALDVLERSEPPPTIHQWCALALTELHATANSLRAAGLPIPTDVEIPGYTAAAWRARKRTHPRAPNLLDFVPSLEPCPPGVIERIVEVLHPAEIWLFGSRARGTAGADSDWDLLVVMPDTTTFPLTSATWGALREVRRQRVEIVPLRRADFELDRHEFGTLAQIATTTGHRVYGG